MYKTLRRCLFLLLVAFSLTLAFVQEAAAQCALLPPILSQGSNKFPNGLCATVNADLEYRITFTTDIPAPPNKVLVYFDWGDGSTITTTQIFQKGTPVGTPAAYVVTQNHVFNNTVSCEYQVTMYVRVNANAICPTTKQTQVISVWRNDSFTGGVVQLLSNTATPVADYKVCVGSTFSVNFNDATTWNCNNTVTAGYSPFGPIQQPNEQQRTRRVLYNTNNPAIASKIPNVTVNGTPVTGPGGADINANYDPSGILNLPPLVTPATTKPATQTIAATGGFGPAFPQVGDRIQITLQYWNICNMYDDPAIPGIGANGDHAPVEQVAYVTIITAPAAPTAADAEYCAGAAAGTYNLTASGAGGTFKWYSNAALTTLVKTGATFNPVNDAGVNRNTTTPISTDYYVTESAAGGCTGPAKKVSFKIDVATLGGTITHTPGTAICTGSTPVAFGSGGAATGGDGTTYTYLWQTTTNTTGCAAPDASWVSAGGVNTAATYTPTATISATTYYRRRATSGVCGVVYSNCIIQYVDTSPSSGAIGSDHTICENPGNPNLLTETTAPTGGAGDGSITYQWQSSTTSLTTGYGNILGATAKTYDPPAGLLVTTFYRRIVTSGVCPTNSATSTGITVTVNAIVNPGTIGNTQTICESSTPAGLTGSAASGGDGTIAYQWQQSAATGGPYTNSPGVSNGQNYAPAALTTKTFYIRKASSGACPATFSNEITVNVNTLPTGTTSGGGSICPPAIAPDVQFAFTGVGPWTFVYSIDGVNQAPIATPTSLYLLTTPAGSPAGVVYRLVSVADSNSPSCLVTAPSPKITGSATVTTQTILPPTLDSFTGTAAVCDNGVGTNPPDGLLDLKPDGVNNYSVSYTLTKVSNGVVTGPFTGTFNSDASGIITLSPTYAQLGGVADTQGYKMIITSLFNTVTLCAGPVPISGPTLIVNPRPTTPSGGLGANACSNPNVGAALTVNDPDPTSTLNTVIVWSKAGAGPSLASFVAATPADGATSGAHNRIFTPATSATATYYAFTSNLTTGCMAANGAAVTQTQDVKPIAAFAGPDQPNLCGTTATLAATAASNGGQGTWTIAGTGAIGANHTANSNVTGLAQDPPLGAPIPVTLTWTVASALGACPVSTDDVILTTNPLPTANVITPQLCDDVVGAPIQAANINLTTYNASVTNAPTVAWYSSNLRTAPFLITAPITVTNGLTVFFRATAAAPTFCTNDGQVTFTVNNLPTATDRNFEFCENAVGFGSTTAINLTTFEMGAGGVTSGGTAATRDVEWYEDNGSGGLGTLIPTGAATGAEENYSISATKTVHAKVIDRTSGVVPKCFDIADVILKYKPRPADNPITGNASVCTGSNIQIYQVDPDLNNYVPGAHTYTWTVTGAADFTIVAGGGTNTANFFVLVKFPGPVVGNVHFTVFETVDGCTGNTKTFDVAVAGAPAALAFNAPATQVCKSSTQPYSLTTNNPSSTYSWAVVGGAVIGSSVGLGLTNVGINWGTLTVPQPSITVTETSSSGCPGTPVSINVFLNDIPAMTSATSIPICSGESPATTGSPLNFTATLPSTFAWTVTSVTGAITTGGVPVVAGNSGTGNITTVLDNTSGFSGSVTYQVTPTESNLPSPPNCTGAPQTVVVTVNPKPVLVANQKKTICAGTSVGYEILVTPSNLPSGTVFSWPDPDGAGPANAGSAPMGVPGTTHIFDVLTNATNAPVVTTYVIKATSSAGCASSTANVEITVEPVPSAAIANTAPLICNGGNTNVTISTLATPTTPANLKFDLAVSSNNAAATGGTSFAPLTNQSFPLNIGGTLTNSSSNSIIVTYTATPKLTGCANGTPVITTVTVEPTPVAAIANTTATICNGANVNLNITSTTTPTVPANLTFDLAVSSTNDAAMGGAAFASLTGQSFPKPITGDLTNSSNASITVTYTVTPKLSGCANGAPQSTTVVVEPTPLTVIANTTPTVCQGGNTSIVISSPSTPSVAANLKFDVAVSSTNNPAMGGTSFVNLSNQTYPVTINGTLTNSSNAAITVTYSVTTKLAGCPNGSPQTTQVVVEPTPAAVVNNTKPTICNGDVTAIAVTSPTSPSVAGTSKYDLSVVSSNPGATSGTAFTNLTNQNYPGNITGNLSNSSSNTITVTFTFTPKLTGCASGTPQVTNVLVEPTPQAAIANTTPLICNGGNINLNITSPTIPSTPANQRFDVAVSSSNNAAMGGTAFTSLSNQTFPLPITGTLTNSGNGSVTVTFTITPKLTGCTDGPVQTTQVVVEPTPTAAIANSTPTICNGGTVALSFSSLTAPSVPANLKYDLAVSSSNSGATGGTAFIALNNQSFPGAVNGTLTNSSNSSVTVTFTATPKLTGCANGTPQTTTVIVEPTPQAVVTNTTPTVCNGDAVNIQISSPTTASVPANLTFDVTVSSSDPGSTGGGAFTPLNAQSFTGNINGVLTNSSNSPITVTFTVTPKLAGCANGAVKTTDVIIEPAPIAVVVNSKPTVCNSTNINIGITTPTTPSVPANLRYDVAVSSSNSAATGGTAFTSASNQNFPGTLNGSLSNSSDANLTVTFTITPKLVGCSNGTPQVVLVVVEPTPKVVLASHKATVCNGDAVDIDITSPSLPSVPGNLKFDVAVSSTNNPATGGSAFANLTGQTFPAHLTGALTNSSTTNQTVTFTVTPKLNGCADGTPKTVQVIVEPTPNAAIANTTAKVCNGGNVALAISTTTVPTIPGNLKYDVAVSSSNAGATGGTAFAPLTAQSFPSAINGTLTNSSNAFITVTFTVTPKLSGCTDGPVVTTNVIVEPTPQATIANTTAGICSGANVNIALTSLSTPSVPSNLTFDVAIASNNTPATGGSAFTTLTSQSFPFTINGVLTNSSSTPVTVTYTITPKLSGCASGPPQVTTVIIEPVPQAVLTNTTPKICTGSTVSVNIASPTNPTVGGDLKFDLAVTSDNTAATSGTAFASLTGQSFSKLINGTLINSSDNFITVTYTVTPTLNGCPNGPVQSTQVIVEPTPVAAINNTTPNICAGSNVSLQVSTPTVPSVAANVKFDVAVSSSNSGATGGTAFAPLTNQAFPFTINGTITNSSNAAITVTFQVTPKLTGCSNGTPVTSMVVVQPTPQAAITNGSATVCNGGAVNLDISSLTTPTTPADLKFDLAVSSTNNAATGGTAYAALTAQTFSQHIGGTLTNSSNSAITVTFTVTPKLAGCADGPTQTTDVIVEPTPQAVVVNNTPTVCNASNVNINISSLSVPSVPANLKFNVAVSSSDAGVTGGGAFTPLTGVSFPQIISGSLTNSSNNFVTVTYTVTPTLAGCADGPPQVTSVIVEPTPKVSVANNNPTVCNGSAVDVQITTPTGPSVPANLTFDVAVSSSNSGATGGTAFVPWVGQSFPFAGITGTLTNSSTSFVTVTFTVTPKLSGCVNGTPVVVQVKVEPTPAVTVVNNKIRVCNNDTPDIDITSTTSPSVPANLLFDVVVTSTDPGNLAGTAAANQNNVAAPFSINASDGTLINNSNSVMTVTFTVTPKLGACISGTPVATNVTLEPTPAVIATNNAPAICSGSSPNIAITTGVTPSDPTDQKFDISVSSNNPGATSGTAFVVQTDKSIPFALNTGTLTNSSTTDVIVTYQFTPKLNGCPNGTPITTQVTVHPIPAVDPTSGSVCSPSTPNVTFTSTVIGTQFAWKLTSITGSTVTGIALNDTGNGATIPNVISNVTSAPAILTFTVTPTGPVGLGSCVGVPKDIVVLVHPEPVMLNPGLDKTTCSDVVTNLVFNTNGTSVAAATYRIEAFNAGGLVENASNVIKTATLLPTTVAAGQLASELFTNQTLTAVDVTYTVRPIGPGPNNCPGQALVVKVTVNPEPFIAPGIATVCSGEAVGATIALGPDVGSVAPTQYELKTVINLSSLVPGPTGNAGLGTYNNGNFLVNDSWINNIDNTVRDIVYEIVPITNGCRGEDASGKGKMVTLHVNPAPDLQDGLASTICSGGTSGIIFSTRSGSAPANNYNITNIVVAAGLVPDGTVNLTFPRTARPANDIASDKFTNPTNGVLTVQYTVVPVTLANCKGVPELVTLTVEPAVTMIIPGDVQTCSDTPTTPNTWSILLNSNTVPSAGDITFDYSAVASPAGTVTGFVIAQNNLPKLGTIADKLVNVSNAVATVKYTITPRAVGAKNGVGCAAGAPTVVTVTVEPRPKLSVSPSTQVVCEGVASSLTLSSTTVPGAGTLRFRQMSAVPTGGMTLTSPPKTFYNNGEVLADIWSNPTIDAQTVTYTFRAEFNGGLNCQSDDITFTLTVNPRPTVTATPQAPICGDGSNFVDITLTPDIATANNLWSAAVTSGTVTGAGPGAGNRIFQTLKNTGTAPATVEYTVTPTSSNCAGTPLVFSVTVDPIPVLTGLPTSVNVCFGGTLSVPLASTVPGVTFNWTVDPFPNSMGVAQTGSGNTITQIISNPTTSQDFLTYTVTATGPGLTACMSQPRSFNVIAAPDENAAILNPDTWLCKNSKDFLQIQLDGQAPFQLVYSDGSSNITLNNVGNFKSIQVQPLVTTTYSLVSIKDAFGCPKPLTGSVTFTVGETDATFAIVGPPIACSPYEVTFQFNQKAGTEYTWRWADGSDDETFIAATDVPNQTILHTFTNASPTSTFKPKVTLQTDLPAPFPGCFKSSTHEVDVYPIIVTNVFPDVTDICSGERIHMTNQSIGVSGHNWFAVVHGTTSPTFLPKSPSLPTDKNVTFEFYNTSTTNPKVYDIVYQATNGNCDAPDVVTSINVYRGKHEDGTEVAAIDTLAIPPFMSGHSIVTVINTSNPVDPSQFRYDWDFGLDANPATASSPGDGSFQFHVDYTSPGPRDIVLTVTNIAAEAAGLTCASTYTLPINIRLLPLAGTFTAIPTVACYPTTIHVNSNTATGDIMQWKLIDGNGKLAGTSNAVLPDFQVTSPGQYTLILNNSSSVDGQTLLPPPQQDIMVYDRPRASFDVRPDIVFVPDTELNTFNFSFGATSYSWNFGDSEDIYSDFQPIYKYPVEGKWDVTLIAINDHGDGAICMDTLKRSVLAKQGGLTKVPNAFTPNPNGPNGGVATNGSFNDVFLPIVKGVEEFNMQIFDRWGNLVFESNSASIGWDGYNADGKLMPAGVYVYKLTVRLSDSQRSTQIGDVTMIR